MGPAPGCGVGHFVGFSGDSGLLLVSPPELLFHLQGQHAQQVLFHHQVAAPQQQALTQLHGQALKRVVPQLNLGEVGELPHPRAETAACCCPRAGPAVSSIGRAQGQCLNVVGCDHQVLKVLQEANVSGQCGQVFVTEVQVAQLAAVEELCGYLLNLL